MASSLMSIGSSAKPAAPEGTPRCRRARAFAFAWALAAATPALGAPAGLLPAERAFAYSARALDDRTLEVRFVIARGYYLYRDKLRFRVEPGTLASPPELPAGLIKEDEFFGRVETYTKELVVRLPLERAAPGERITIRTESQGCADAGVCYPPQAQDIALTLPATGKGPGQWVQAVPPRKAWFN